MADGLNRNVAEQASGVLDSRSTPVRPRASEESGLPRDTFPHAGKFRAAMGVLAGLGVGAVVLAAVILINNRSSSPSQAWSSWSPPDSGAIGARDIADHLAPLYRISGTKQLAVVTLVSLANSTAAQAAQATGANPPSGLQVAVQTDATARSTSLLTGNTIAYNLCGVGTTNCSIAGTVSSAQLLLLRREALELALYTFKYISGTDNVVAILPPSHTVVSCSLCARPNQTPTIKPETTALLFLHSELSPWLSQPLSDTLPEQVPPTVSQMPGAPEAALVEQITARGLFTESIEGTQDGSNLLLLKPQPPS